MAACGAAAAAWRRVRQVEEEVRLEEVVALAYPVHQVEEEAVVAEVVGVLQSLRLS